MTKRRTNQTTKTTTRKRTPEMVLAALQTAISKACSNFKPPEDITVAEWADKYRRLPFGLTAEAGPWRTERTPYLKGIMEAFNDPKVSNIVMVASSQVGKSELELNIIGYIISHDPGSILYVQPSTEDAKKFSRLRVAPMIRDCKILRGKVHSIKSRSSGNTILQKSFPGGMLTITGSNSASALASTPARYIIGDERDRWAVSAGTEGDPWELAKARQATFYNAKSVEVSTPTIKDASNIETSFLFGTQERWHHQCPGCGEFHEIKFDNIDYTAEKLRLGKRSSYKIILKGWRCPDCGKVFEENVMKKQPAKWVAENEEALEVSGSRSFWLNTFSSPWTSWKKICQRFMEAKDDPEKLQVVKNTLFGELWENRSTEQTEEKLITRLEDYPAELPGGVLVLTCGVDTQDDRLEYEVVGWGKNYESWGIKKGFIFGRPDTEDVWKRLDDVLDRTYKFKNGRGLLISITCVDSGGHFTQEVYIQCRQRQHKRVFAIKGKGGEGIPLISPPNKIPIKNKKTTAWLYSLGVDAGKSSIYTSLEIETPGTKYCHWPKGEERGYDYNYFQGLLSEAQKRVRSGGGYKWVWEKRSEHARNEALDCRNYAWCALKIMDPDMDAVEKRLLELAAENLADAKPIRKQQVKPKRKIQDILDDW